LIVEPCELPPRIKALVPADFTDLTSRQEAFNRLLRSLARSAQEINEATTSTVKQGIFALAKLLRYPTVQTVLSSYQDALADASAKIGDLGRYKGLHDRFQRVEVAYKPLFLFRESGAASANKWDFLEGLVWALTDELEKLLQFARDGGFPTNELLWTSKIERVCSDLQSAVDDQDDEKLGGICERLLNVLATQLTRINDRLVMTAGQLALGAVAD